MSIRGTVGSLIENHCAKSSHPDRRNLIPQTGRLWTARTCPRFGTGRHVSQSESGDVSPHSKLKRCQFLKQFPQLRSTVPNSPPAVPDFPDDHPHFPGDAPQGKSSRPHFSDGRPQFPGHRFPQFFLPVFRHHFQWPVPQTFMQNCRKKSQKAQKQPSPVLPDTLSHRMGEGRGEGCHFFPQLRTANSQLLKL